MKIKPALLPGVVEVEPRIFRDLRGRFHELWTARDYDFVGAQFVQDNCSVSAKGVVRGLHFQYDRPQGKLISVVEGRIFDVAVDLRVDSETFGKWVGVELSAEKANQLWIPAGFAHGFAALEPSTVIYKCTEYYDPALEGIIRWNDPAIGICWPVENPVISFKDARAPGLHSLDSGRLGRRSR